MKRKARPACYARAWCYRCRLLLVWSGERAHRAVGLRCSVCDHWYHVGAVGRSDLKGSKIASAATWTLDSMIGV